MTRWIWTGLAGLGALALCACTMADAVAQSTVIRLDPATRYQTITGWEVTAELDVQRVNPAWFSVRNAVFAGAADLGLSRVRLEIGSGAENRPNRFSPVFEAYMAGDLDDGDYYELRYHPTNDNDDPDRIDWAGFDFAELDWSIRNAVLPLRAALAAKGERLHVNLCYVSFTEDQPRDLSGVHLDPEEYGEFVLATYLYMQKTHGFVPDTWEVILEPDLVPAWQLESGKVIGRAIAAAARRLTAAGFTPRFVAPSNTSMNWVIPFTEGIASVPGAIEHVVEMSYHRYDPDARTPDHTRAIAETAAKYGLQTSMLEWWFGNATHHVLHEDLKIGNVSAWQGRVTGLLYDLQPPGTEPGTQTLQDDVRMTSLYFRAARPGDQRIGATSSDETGIDPLGFQSPDGTMAVILRAERGGLVRVEGLRPGRYTLEYGTQNASIRHADPLIVDADGVATLHMPDAGVLTLRGRN